MPKSLRRLAALIRKEAIQAVRDRRTLVLSLTMPVIVLFFLGYAVSLSVEHIPTAVADMSLDGRSREFIDALTVSGYFDVERYVETEEEVIRAIDRGQAQAGLVIPPDFAAQVERGEGQVLLLLDGSQQFTVQFGYSAALNIAQAHAVKLLTAKAGQMGFAAMGELPITTAMRVRYNPNMDAMLFLIPVLAGLLMQIMSFNLTALSVVREREIGTTEQLLVTPARPLELMVSKVVPSLVLSTVSMSIVVLLGVYWFRVPFQGNVWHFATLSLVFTVSSLGLGLLVSTVVSTQKGAQQVSSLIMLLTIMLTGFVFPQSTMIPIARAIGSLMPLTYFARIVRAIYTRGVSITSVRTDAVILVLYSVGIVVLAAVSFKKRLD